MKIIIPMSGLGKRFQEAGYKDIKPLIKVHGKPIIEWVVKMFPGEHEFVFICRKNHLEETPLRQVLNKIQPNAKIMGIDGHKLGPVYAVLQVLDLIKDDEEVIVNYCDFFQDWDLNHFLNTMKENQFDGAIPCYTGFHPNLLHPENLYASCKKDKSGNLLEIKEKFSFEFDKTKTSHSSGTYYFSKGRFVKKYFQQLVDEHINLNGEYYISLVYNLMVADNLKINVYDEIAHFCQWGTPKDMEEYNTWMQIMKHYDEEGVLV